MNISFKIKLQLFLKISDQIPAIVIIHDVNSLSVEFFSKRACDGLGVTLEEIKAMGNEYTGDSLILKIRQIISPRL